MKQGLFTLGLSVALSIMAGCRSQQEGWKLVWEENFDQEDHFDEASWSKIPRGKSDWNNIYVGLRFLLYYARWQFGFAWISQLQFAG